MAAKLTAEFLKDWKNDVNTDLQKERDTATFKTEELTYILDGGAEKTKRRKELGKCVMDGVRKWVPCPELELQVEAMWMEIKDKDFFLKQTTIAL